MATRRRYARLEMGPAADVVVQARRFEADGVDTAWAAQIDGTPFVPLAAVAAATSRMHLGSAIALAFTRSPMETALTALDMDRLTGGRFKLGLGTGAKRLNERWHGVSDYGRPAPHLRECLELVRLLVEQGARGEPVTYHGKYYGMDLRGWRPSREPARATIPLYVAGMGEAMARVAGDVADGLLGPPLWSLRWIREAIRPNVEVGLQRSGRRRASFDLSAQVLTFPCEADPGSRRAARRAAAGVVARYAASRAYAPVFAWHGWTAEAEAAHAAREAHGAGDDAVLECITDAMIEAFCVVGAAQEVEERLEEWWESVDSLMRVEHGSSAGALGDHASQGRLPPHDALRDQ